MNIFDLLKTGQIDEREYKSYLVYEVDEIGRELFKKSFEGAYMEESPEMSEAAFSWLDGRRSVWRDAKNAINKVKYLLNNSEVIEDE